jgi:hypothetical protein
MPENSNLERQITFLVEVDKLKSVLRRNYVIHSNRRENSTKRNGRGWSENGIKRYRVFAVNEQVIDGSAALWEKIQSFIDSATRKGFLQDG